MAALGIQIAGLFERFKSAIPIEVTEKLQNFAERKFAKNRPIEFWVDVSPIRAPNALFTEQLSKEDVPARLRRLAR